MRLRWLLSFACAFLIVGLLTGTERKPESRIGKRVTDLTLKDAAGKSVSLADFKERKALVVLFLGTECPINNAYLPWVAELSKRYQDKGVQFLGINANHQDSAELVAAHARRYVIPFPVLKDEELKAANVFGAERTPEAFVLDAERTIRYQGRIDDQFGLTYRRPGKPTRQDLVEALDEVLAGRAVTVATTPVAGCLIPRDRQPKATASVTWTRDVSRIMQSHCQECHRPGQIGPMALLTYDSARDWSGMIREVLDDGRMPPWHADPRFGKFANDRRMPQDAREKLLAWIDAGCPRGDDKDLPAPRQFVDGWGIGKPDMIFTMGEEYQVPASAGKGGIPYQYFTIDPGFKEDVWVTRAEARAGNPAVVHHVLVFIIAPGVTFVPKLGNAPVLCGTAPGDMPLMLPEGMAKKIPAGSKLLMQMHYTPNGQAQPDRSSLGIAVTKEKPQRRVRTIPIAVPPPGLIIPPHAENHKVESSYTFREDGHALTFMPHMHLRGKDFLIEAIYPDGRKETLLSIPRYDFNWQSVYRCAQPLPMPKGTRIHCVAHFDNSAKNPNNPDPSKRVTWGDQTWEEMMIGWLDMVYDTPAE